MAQVLSLAIVLANTIVMAMAIAIATTIAMAMALAMPPPRPPLTSYDLNDQNLFKACLTDWQTGRLTE